MTDERLSRAARSQLMVDTRRRIIMSAATALAADIGYGKVTRNEIARRAGIASGSINYHFGTIDALRDAIVTEAVETENFVIIRQAIANNHPAVQNAAPGMRERALAA